eukprot:6806921-Pyramimonas_sp.AAC.2
MSGLCSTACLRRTIKRPGRAVVPQRWAVGGHIKALLRYPDGTWGQPRVLYDMSSDAGIPKVVANKLSVLSSGEWVLPFWRQRSYQVCETNKEFNSVGVLISRNEGATWAAYGALHLRYQSHWCANPPLGDRGHGDGDVQPHITDAPPIL